MILLFEEGIRGGITQSVTKYATANNKYMSTYDKNKPSTFIQYSDANGLYGAAMLRPLPTGNFEWVGSSSNCSYLFHLLIEGN